MNRRSGARGSVRDVIRAWVGPVALALLATVVQAAPITDPQQIWVLQLDDLSRVHSTWTAATRVHEVYASSSGQDLQARADLASGELGTRVDSLGQGGLSLVAMFDTISFSAPWAGPTEVAFTVQLEGSLTAVSARSWPGLDYSVSFYDITGLPYWLQTVPSDDYGTEVWPVGGATRVASLSIDLDVFDSMPRGSYAHDIVRTGSLLALPGHTYGIRIAMQSSVNIGQASSDFLGTGSFRFSDLAGASVSSGSGVFLSQASPVDAPPAAWSMLGGLLALLAAARRSGRGA